MRLVLMTSIQTQLPAVALVDRLLADGHEIALVVEARVKEVGAPRRLCQLRRQKLLGEKMIGDSPNRQAALSAELTLRGVNARTLTAICDERGIKRIRARALNDDMLRLEIEALGADLIIALFEDSAIVDLASAAANGVICVCPHARPEFAGPDADEWALFFGGRPGVTLLHLPPWTETGETALVVERQTVAPGPTDLETVQGLVDYEMVEVAARAVQRLHADGDLGGTPIARARRPLGLMAEPLRQAVQRWVDTGRTPTAGA
jgi:hypothetical protein